MGIVREISDDSSCRIFIIFDVCARTLYIIGFVTQGFGIERYHSHKEKSYER